MIRMYPEQLLETLNAVAAGVVTGKRVYSNLDHVHLHAAGERLHITSCDTQVFFQATASARVGTHFTTLVPFQQLRELARLMDFDEPVSMAYEDGKLIVSQQRSTTRFITADPDNFPAVRTLNDAQHVATISAATMQAMKTALNHIASFAKGGGPVVSDYLHLGVTGDTLTLTGVNRHARSDAQFTVDGHVDDRFALPPKTLKAAFATLAKQDCPVNVYRAGNMLAFAVNGVTLFLDSDAVVLPDYECVPVASATLPYKTIAPALKQAKRDGRLHIAFGQPTDFITDALTIPVILDWTPDVMADDLLTCTTPDDTLEFGQEKALPYLDKALTFRKTIKSREEALTLTIVLNTAGTTALQITGRGITDLVFAG